MPEKNFLQTTRNKLLEFIEEDGPFAVGAILFLTPIFLIMWTAAAIIIFTAIGHLF